MIRIAINGFGRIGRTFLRQLKQDDPIQLVAINDLSTPEILAHLLKYDSIHRAFPGKVWHDEKHIFINGNAVPLFSEKDPLALPWKDLDVDLVLECTGHFTEKEKASLHLKAGAKRVLISAPAKGDLKTVVMGVNEHTLNAGDQIFSNASCTTNNVAPMIDILDKNFGVISAFVSTVHAYTGDQNLHDAPHRDLRRARAAAHSIIPTTTGAAKAVAEIFPHLRGKLGGAGIRVPVIDGSMTDVTCVVERTSNETKINQLFKKASEGTLNGILQYTEDPIVSVDIIGNSHSCIFDAQLTSVLNNGNLVKVVGWYDNETGYSARLRDLIMHTLRN